MRRAITNQNQIIGAGVGYASDLQSIKLKYQTNNHPWVFQLNYDRIQRDPIDKLVKWKDETYSLEPSYRYNKLKIKLSLNFISSKNYNWIQGKNTFNLLSRVQINYSI